MGESLSMCDEVPAVAFRAVCLVSASLSLSCCVKSPHVQTQEELCLAVIGLTVERFSTAYGDTGYTALSVITHVSG